MKNVYPLPVGWKLQDAPNEPRGARDVVALDQDVEDVDTWYAVTISSTGVPTREVIAGTTMLIYRGPA